MFVISKTFLFVTVNIDENDTISSNVDTNLSLPESQLTPDIFFEDFTSMGQFFFVSHIFSHNCLELVNHYINRCPEKCLHGKSSPENCPQKNSHPLPLPSGKLPPKKIAPGKIVPHLQRKKKKNKKINSRENTSKVKYKGKRRDVKKID